MVSMINQHMGPSNGIQYVSNFEASPYETKRQRVMNEDNNNEMTTKRPIP